MREARERTEYERSRDNKKRQKEGKPPLPEETFEDHYKATLKKIFDEIEERKIHVAKQEATKKA